VYIDNSCAVIDLDVVAENYRAIARKAGVPVMAIIKANAYGHGAVQIARKLKDICGFFGVATIVEALELRRAGITASVLVLGQTPPEAFPIAVAEGIRLAIFRYEDALALSEAAQAAGKEVPFHLCVDTGMSRIGFQVTEEEADICAKLCRLPGLVPEGMFSHFATADAEELTRASAQAERFDAFDRMLKSRGVEIKLRHLDNSAGIVRFENHYEMVRAGIILYGLYPSREVDLSGLDLRPVLDWSTRIVLIKTLEAGREISYGGTFSTTRPTRVATVPVGYADGYRRSLSGKFYVLIHGQQAPILGRICMDQFMVDVTDIPDAQVGDQVVLVGKDGEQTITMDAIGEAAGTIGYEFACGIDRRVFRVYRENGETVQTVRHLLNEVSTGGAL